MLRLLICLFFVNGCAKAKDEIEPQPATPTVAQQFDDASARVEARFLDQGEVVSRNIVGGVEHAGDSNFFSALYVAASRCNGALTTEATMQQGLIAHGGQVWRHHSIDDASIDPVIATLRAVAARFRKGCDVTGWQKPLQMLKGYADEHHGAINQHSVAGLDVFDYALRAVLDRISGGRDPDFDADARDLYSRAVGSWPVPIAAAFQLYKKGVTQKIPPAAYRVHLALLSFQTLDDLGIDIPHVDRDRFCATSAGFDMPSVDHWCGRAPITDWLATFVQNQWEFRLQRAGAWETPDGQGFETPSIDYLTGLDTGYSL